MEQNPCLEANCPSDTFKFDRHVFHEARRLHNERFELSEGDSHFLCAFRTFIYRLCIYDKFRALYAFFISSMHEKLASFKYRDEKY